MSKSPKLKMIGDSWLGTVLERPAFRLELALDQIESKDVKAALADLPAGSFCFSKVEIARNNLVGILCGAGFNLVETAVTFDKERNTSPVKGSHGVRFAEPRDKENIATVAIESFVHSRFHRDPKIGSLLAGKLKGEWTRNYFQGKRGSHMIVSELEGSIAGFLQIISHGDSFIVDLIGVSPRFQRRGVARCMIEFAEANLKEFKSVVVGTQLVNVPSVRLYEGLGFRLKGAVHVFHAHCA